jgi:mRNA interferase HigB
LRVISRRKLKDAASIYAELTSPLDSWHKITRLAEWRNLADVRRTWATADIYGNCTIFNIKGNKYRLIAWINYHTQKVFIRYVLTHAEYTKGAWENDCTSS